MSELTHTEETLSIERVRHSCSHVLAQAVQRLFPDAILGIGPVIENGFYYDFELPRSLNDDDLNQLEVYMKEIIRENQAFKNYHLSREEAEAYLTEKKQPYKLEIIHDLNLESYSFFENGPFIDLCKGPHVRYTKQIKAFKLLKVAGAYWRGSEKNKMLQRIYGVAFHTKDELAAYLTQLEEAKKRDHRLIGKQLDLFSVSEDVGGGLVLWHPKGAYIRHIIETVWKESHFRKEYQLLNSPHIGKSDLWKISGHLDCYQENMYSSIKVDEQDYYLKPMNCPFHILTYTSNHHSYRQLPVRYAELGTVYRYERSGVLQGLFRVRGFTQDDAHIICTPSQVESEIHSVLKFCVETLQLFGFESFKTFISTKPKEKAVGDDASWSMAQKSLEDAVTSLGIDYEIDEGGGAFYGPKIDVKIKDSIGREWQCSTIQFDFNLPDRFDMTFINSEGQKERPFMIHRALLGSLERFFGILIEHYEGKFPTWLSPTQIKILTINDSFSDYAASVKEQLSRAYLRSEIDDSSEKIGYKIRQAISEKVPYMIIIGKNEVEHQHISVRSRDHGELGQLSVADLIKTIKDETPLSVQSLLKQV